MKGIYTVTKRLEISAAHFLKLDYESKCTGIHGHNWSVVVTCKSETLDQNGMVIDFAEVKRMIQDKLDHKLLNDVFPGNPTAENLAKWIVDTVPHCIKAVVCESAGNEASYELV